MKHAGFGRLGAVAIGVALSVGLLSDVAEARELRTVHFISAEGSLFRQGFAQFVDRLNADGNGLVTVDRVLGPDAVPERQIGQALRNGIIDMAALPPSWMSNFVPGAEALTAMTVDMATIRASGAFDLINEAFQRDANIYLLGMFGKDVMYHLFLNVPIEGIDGFRNVRLRTTPTYRAFFDELGAQQIQTSRGEIFTALERRVVNGFANPASEVAAAGWQEVVSYRIDPPFYDASVVVALNLDTWNSLSAEQQDFLKAMAVVLEQEIAPTIAARDVEIAAELVAGGMNVIELEGEEAERYLDAAYTTTWDSIVASSPELGAALRDLAGPK